MIVRLVTYVHHHKYGVSFDTVPIPMDVEVTEEYVAENCLQEAFEPEEDEFLDFSVKTVSGSASECASKCDTCGEGFPCACLCVDDRGKPDYPVRDAPGARRSRTWRSGWTRKRGR